jgi:zinc finger protein
MGGDNPRGQAPPADPRVSSSDPLLLGEGEATYISVRCPSCAAPEATLRTLGLDIPYFGEIIESVFLCARCGFRHTDMMIPRRSTPTEYSIKVEGERDLFVRAVKSCSATVEVPELGLLWEPGPASNAEVTNVEGLLMRFDDAVRRAMALFEGEDNAAKAREILAALADANDGRRVVTVVIRDPYGNSALIDPRGRVTRRELSPKEAEELATGEYVFDLQGGQPVGLRRV